MFDRSLTKEFDGSLNVGKSCRLMIDSVVIFAHSVVNAANIHRISASKLLKPGEEYALSTTHSRP